MKSTSTNGHDPAARTLAGGLGWFSIGLGLLEVTAAEKVAGALGMEGHETLIRLYGIRELAAGLGILTSADKEPWLRARIAGDALDLGTLAFALHDGNPQRRNARLALMAVAGLTALDVWCAGRLRREKTEERSLGALADYSARSGFPGGLRGAFGAARDFAAPADMRTPGALRPYQT